MNPVCSDSVKVLGVFRPVDTKLYIHDHVSYIYSVSVKLLYRVRTATVIVIFYLRRKLQYASVVLKSLTSVHVKEL